MQDLIDIYEDMKARSGKVDFVDLLVRLERFDEAITASCEFFSEAAPVNSPSTLQLCQIAGEFGKLRALARDNDDATVVVVKNAESRAPQL